MTRIIGSYLSTYVRKVLVCLELKEIPYDIDPIVSFCGNDEFSVIRPIRRYVWGEQRDALPSAGAPISSETFSSSNLRRGVLSI